MPSPTATWSPARPGPRSTPGSPNSSWSSAQRSEPSCNRQIFASDRCKKQISGFALPKNLFTGDNFVLRISRKGDSTVMANVITKKGVIGILTGGGDVPGLNPAIRGVTLRALREGYQVIGIRHGWAGLVDMVREHGYDNSDNFFLLAEQTVDRPSRTG